MEKMQKRTPLKKYSLNQQIVQKYAIADLMVPMSLTLRKIKFEKNYTPFSEFKCDLQQYYFFSNVPVCNQNPKDIN